MTNLAMIKLYVSDLDRSEAFYRAVSGFDQIERIKGKGFSEVILRPSGDMTGAALVLFADGSTPLPGEAMLVFETEDLEQFAARVIAAGGEVTNRPCTVAQLGLSFAMFRDAEGHAIEALSRQDP